MKKISFFFNELKATFWFIPVLLLIISIVLAIGLVILDQVVTLSQDGLGRFFYVNSAGSARTILSTISGAMIGVAGTVFSVTLVALTLASSQFGPRLIRNFMNVRLNQLVLGSFISTYLYCLIVLNAIKESDLYTFIPVISILFAILAAFINTILLIVFIHKIATSIQADKVIAEISDVISKDIKSLFPKETDGEFTDEKTMPIDKIKSKYHHSINVKAKKSGYLQYIDYNSLMNALCSFDGLIELHFRPGDHLVEDIALGKLYSKDKLDEEQLDRISNQFVIGKIRVSQQDLEFSIQQMVEIAARALSPGINDPFTAIACIDNLTSTMCHLSQISFPSKYRIDEEKNLRIVEDTLEFEGVLDVSFNQIRQFSIGSPAVIIRLMEALITIDGFAKKEAYKKAIIKHATMVMNVGKDYIKEKNDLKDLEERSKKIIPD